MGIVAGGADGPRSGGRGRGRAAVVTGGALAPAGAVAWVRSLSPDTVAVAVVDAAGAVLAGDADVGHRASGALAAHPGEEEIRDGDLLVVRGAGPAVAAVLEPGTLVRVARLDLRAAAAALARG